MTISITRATPADADSMVKVQVAAFHYDSVMYPDVALGGPPGYDDVATMLEKIAQDETYKITEGDRCIGGIVVYDRGDGHYHLDLIFLDPAYHNRGIGTQAMHFIEQTYPARVWSLDTPTYALRNQHFYEKFGYVKLYEHDENPDIRLIAYEKRVERGSV